MQGAWKVGLLVIVFVGLLLGAYAFLGRTILQKKTNTFYADFTDAGGVTQGTKVLMSGVRIGQVSKVQLLEPTRARLTMEIDEDISIPEGSSAYLPTSLIGLGDNPLQIVPSGRSTGTLPPKTVMNGIRGGALDKLFPNAEGTIEELNKTLVATQGLLNDKGLRADLKKLMSTSEQTVAQFGKLANRLDTTIAQNQGTLQQALRSASQAMADIQQTTALVAEMLKDDRWKDKAMLMLDEITKTTVKAQDLIVSLDNFVNDPKLRDPLVQVAQNTQIITERGTQIAANAEEITKNGIEISKNGVTISEQAIELARKANEIADEAKAALRNVSGFFGKTASGAGAALGGIQANFDLIRESDPNRVRTDLEVTVPFGDSKFHLGLWDAFESNKVTLQFGKQFAPKGEFRYGIFASKPGVGVDYEVAPRLFLRGDLFDINNPRADLRARYEFGKGFYGWLGVNQVFKNNAPLIGFGFRK